MSTRRLRPYLFFVLLVLVLAGIQMKSASPAADPPQVATLLAGRNVNMVSGTRLPWGDPWLQRQNEPSLAASSRNPMHLLAGANDYRTIDMPDNYKVPGIPSQAAARDAWLGLFKSFDGGQSWITTLLPGYPQDSSLQGLASPIHGFDAACDPSVRAGSNGMFYYSGIAFNRAGGAGAVFLARFIDNNNLEEIKFDEILDNNGQWNHRVPKDDPIKYVDTRVVDTGNSGQFIDMPTVAVDIPRSGLAGTSTIYGQSIPNSNVYLAYTVFLGNFDVNIRSRLMLARSTNSGQTWNKPIKLSESQHIIQRPIIAIDPKNPTGNTVYVAFRRFAFGTTPGGIVICKSTDGGQTFTKPIEVETLLYPFDQAQTGSSFRTNSYPTMAIDGNGVVHIAWAQRMNGPAGQSRIVIKTSPDGIVWSGSATPIETTDEVGQPLKGNQFMPSMTFAAGRLLLAWYDQRETLSPDDNTGVVADAYPNRQTIDVRATEAIPGLAPIVSRSHQVSRYLFFLELDEDGNPVEEGGYYKAVQAEYSPPNLPLFQLGTRSFYGDYIDLAPAPLILPPPVANGSWAYNTAGSGHPVEFHSAWTDNRDVRPPADGWWGDWVTYAPPNSDQDALFAQQNPCGNSNGAGLRNQNVYTANIGKGVFVGSPGNTKQLDIAENLDGGRRTFVVIVKNSTEFDKEFEVALDGLGGNIASFTQTGDTDSLHIAVAAYSSYSCTVFVDEAGGQILPVKVNVYEGGLFVGYALLNPDATNLPVSDPDIPSADLGFEKHNPRVMNPRVWNYDLGNANEPNPRVMNPRVMNPRVMNPRVMNPRVMNPRVMNPRVMNPRVMNDSIVSYEVANPRVMNPQVMNTALTDVTWLVSNEGNTTSAYKFDIVSTYDQYFSGTGALIGQVLVYKAHMTPAGYQCGLYEVQDDELLVNITNPRVMNPRVMNNVPDEGQGSTAQATNLTTNGEIPQDVAFYLAPGEEAYITFRVWDDDTTDNISFNTQTVTAYVEAEAINTGDTTPTYDYPPNVPWITPLPQVGTYPPSLTFYAVPGELPANQTLTIWNAGGGTLEYTLSKDVDWLTVTPEGGTSTSPSDQKGHVVAVTNASKPIGTYQGFITVYDPDASNNPFKLPVTFIVSPTPPLLAVEWVARYDGPANGFDHFRALALDGAGNVYVAGETTISAGNTDFVTIKYDPSGNMLWQRTYNGPGNGKDMPNAIAVNPAGNVVVAGESRGAGGDQDYATVKYDSAGNQLWAARYGGLAAGFDSVYCVTMDTSGNVSVTGLANGTGGKSDIATIKYASATGAEVWRAIYNGAANDYDVGFEVEVDLLGNVYVSGECGDGTEADYVTLKYNSSGTMLWEAKYAGPGEGRDVANELAVDAAGNVYVSGNSGGSGTGNDYATIKYDSSGNELWVVQRYTGAGTGSDSVQELILGPDGSAYVTGWSQRTGVLRDIMTIRYSSSGTELWRAKYNGLGDGDNVAFELALDPSGDLYVTGGSSEGTGSEEFVTIKYSNSGKETWIRRYHGSGTGDDFAHEVALDAAGNVYVGGVSYGDGTGADLATIKYRPELEDWHAEYNGPANRDDDPVVVAVDDSGYVYVTGSSVNSSGNSDYLTIKYDPAGVKLWETRYDGPGNGDDVPEAIAVDSAGNVYVTGSSVGISTGRDYATIMYDSAGNAVWAGTAVRYNRDAVNGEDMAHAIALDSAGIYVTGRSFNGTDFDWLTIKYNPTGTIAWTTAYDNGGGDWPFAMTVDGSGDVYVTGESVIVDEGIPTVDTEMTTVKYSGSDGSQLFVDRYTDTLFPGFTDISQATDIAIRSDLPGGTAIVVTGLSNGYEAGSNFVTIKYDTSLNRLWTKTYNGPGGSDDMPVGVEIDWEGNVYVTGDSYGGPTTNRDFATIKYGGDDGTVVWIRRFNGTSSLDDAPAGIALDASGNAYVTGWSTGANLKTEFATVKYDSSGVGRWLTFFRGGLLGEDRAKAVAVDVEGNVFVTGQTQFYATGPIIHFNFMTFKYRKEGF